jgi:hypothetical protein
MTCLLLRRTTAHRQALQPLNVQRQWRLRNGQAASVARPVYALRPAPKVTQVTESMNAKFNIVASGFDIIWLTF